MPDNADPTDQIEAIISLPFKFRDQDLALASALLEDETFSYADLALATGLTIGAIKGKFGRRWKDNGFYPLVRTGETLPSTSGRPQEVFRLAPGIADVLNAALAEWEDSAEDDEEQLSSADLPLLKTIRVLQEDTALEHDLAAAVHRLTVLDRDWGRLQAVLATSANGDAQAFEPELVWKVETLRRQREKIERRFEAKAASHAASALECARLCGEAFENLDRLSGIIETRFTDADAGVEGASFALVGIPIAIGQHETRHKRINKVLGQMMKEGEREKVMFRALREARELGKRYTNWHGLALDAMGGVFQSTYLARNAEIEAEAERCFEAASLEEKRKFAVHAPCGLGRGLSHGALFVEDAGQGTAGDQDLAKDVDNGTESAPDSGDPSEWFETKDLTAVAKGLVRHFFGDGSGRRASAFEGLFGKDAGQQRPMTG